MYEDDDADKLLHQRTRDEDREVVGDMYIKTVCKWEQIVVVVVTDRNKNHD